MIYLENAKHCLPVGIMSSPGLLLVKPLLQFLHNTYWRLQTGGLNQFPDHGPAFIVSNISGSLPWTAITIGYVLSTHANYNQRQINILADIHNIADERIYPFLRALNFMPWSYDNVKNLLAKGEVVIAFPEDKSYISKKGPMRNRLNRFDWTKFLPAMEASVPIYPMAIMGADDINPLSTARKIRLICSLHYERIQERNLLQNEAKKAALFAEGEIQAEINRLLRVKNRH